MTKYTQKNTDLAEGTGANGLSRACEIMVSTSRKDLESKQYDCEPPARHQVCRRNKSWLQSCVSDLSFCLFLGWKFI